MYPLAGLTNLVGNPPHLREADLAACHNAHIG
jgi:hypothetical protein